MEVDGLVLTILVCLLGSGSFLLIGGKDLVVRSRWFLLALGRVQAASFSPASIIRKFLSISMIPQLMSTAEPFLA